MAESISVGSGCGIKSSCQIAVIISSSQIKKISVNYPLSYGVPVRERYGSTFLPATREQHDQNCTQSQGT